MKTAHFLGRIAIHLSFIGRFMESMDCAFESVLISRSLVAENPASHTLILACCLANLGFRLSNLNRHEESLGATQESITLYRSLVDKDPASYTTHLAR